MKMAQAEIEEHKKEAIAVKKKSETEGYVLIGGGYSYAPLRWRHAGLSIQIDKSTTILDIVFGIKNHDSVCEFLSQHWDDENFEEKYFHKPGEVNYYKVLTLVEKEAA